MATYQGPAQTIHRAKIRECEMYSMGYTRQPMQAPLKAHFTLINRTDDVGIEITLSPSEAFKLERHLKEFREQRELATKPAA